MLIVRDTRFFEEDFIDTESNIKIGKGTKLEPNVVIYDDCSIGQTCIIGTGAILKSDTHIGDHSIFGALSVTESDVKIGSWSTIHSQCHITAGVNIGNHVFIGPGFVTTNTPNMSLGKFGYPNSTNDSRLRLVIEDGVRIGGSVAVAPGVTIGKNSLVDMGCLLVKNIPSNSHVRADKSIVGKIIGKIDPT